MKDPLKNYEPKRPSNDREVRHSIPDHQILLSWNGDEDAALFDEWWSRFGWDIAKKWIKAEKIERSSP